MDAYEDSSGAIIDFMFPVLRHPPMRLEPGFFRFISYPLPSPPSLVDLFSHAYLILCEMTPAERPHAHGTPGAATEERGQEGDKPCLERGIAEGEGGQDKEAV
jgi:hypothetical protein